MRIYMDKIHLTQVIIFIIRQMCEWDHSLKSWDCTFNRDWTSSPTRRRKPPHCRQFPSQPGSITAEPHLHKTWHVFCIHRYILSSVYSVYCNEQSLPAFFGFQSTPRCSRRRPHSLLSSQLAPTPHPASASTATMATTLPSLWTFLSVWQVKVKV